MKDSNKTPVIFIDIDGPFLPARMHYSNNASFIFDLKQKWKSSFETRKSIIFDPVMCYILNQWIKITNSRIVFSTDWTKSCSKNELAEIFDRNGVNNLSFHSNWKTTKNIDGYSRADEIAHWLSHNKDSYSNYLILEDDNSVLNHPSIDHSKVLLIDFLNGISWKQIFEGCEILGITDYYLLEPNGRPKM